MLPLMGLLIVVTLHWGQFLPLFGLGPELADFGLRLKRPPLPWIYVTVILALVLLFEILPYVEELVRSIRRDKQSRRIDGSEQGQSRSSRRPL
jgi:hypothetical protein